MKARIGIMSEDLIRRHMINVAAGNTTHNKHIPSLWFTSLDEASKLLCNENIELMILMSKEKPDSLSELAEISGHHTANCHENSTSYHQKDLFSSRRKAMLVAP
ncbi:transcriptional regulator [Vibrio parahaemolyticus]